MQLLSGEEFATESEPERVFAITSVLLGWREGLVVSIDQSDLHQERINDEPAVGRIKQPSCVVAQA